MLKVKFFFNKPNGKPCKHFKKMIPRISEKFDVEIETMSKPIKEYNTDEYFELDLPVAPAIMVGDEIVVEGADISDEKVEEVLRKHLGLS